MQRVRNPINHGARFEGDVFSVLRHSPYVTRAFEFALADGAVSCNFAFDTTSTYAARFWQVDQRQRYPDLSDKACELLLFDVKSTTSAIAGGQVYLTTFRQRREVAFFVCICANDPTFVELIPNYYQHVKNLDRLDNEEVAVNNARHSKLPPSAYRLDPAGSPRRLPIALLPEAISRIRQCAQNQQDYINPWTLVAEKNWRPQATSSVEHLKPAEHTEHYSAYLAAINIYRLVTTISTPVDMSFDFIGVQPKIADFKIVLTDSKTAAQRQFFVQHKLDARERAFTTPLTKVFIGRSTKRGVDWYFTPTERFDFLFYEFQMSVGSHLPRRKECFFLPENVIPDTFYTSTDCEASFDLPQFAPYRIHMDRDGQWVTRMCEIIQHNLQPRQTAPRPYRCIEPKSLPEAEDSGDVSFDAAENLRRHLKTSYHGLQHYVSMMTRCHQTFFYSIMTQCATERSGMLLLLGDHPLGDFAFCCYQWSESERQSFLDSGQPPLTIDLVPPQTPVIPLYYFSRDVEMNFLGPQVLGTEFRRLNSSMLGRLVFLNIFGTDEAEVKGTIAVIPSHDILPTESQLAPLIRNQGIDKSTQFAERTPAFQHMLQIGYQLSDYAVGHHTPFATHEENWKAVWSFLDQWTRVQPLQHPENRRRDTLIYRHPLRLLNECLLAEDNRDKSRV